MSPTDNTQTTPLTPPDLVVRGKRVILPEGERAAAVQIRGGAIAAISAFDDVPAGCPLHEAGESVVMPGLVDTHVHINEPGRTEWEGFSSATRAAAAGGVTTLIEMPLNSIPATTSAAAYREKLAAAAGKLSVDVGFWGGVVPGNVGELRPLWDAGVLGFKCFLVPSGVEEFAHVSETDLCAAAPELAALGAPLLAHAEMPGPIAAALKDLPKANPKSYTTWLVSRPRQAENEAIAFLVRLSREFGIRTHIVHLSSSDAIQALQKAKSDGLAVSVETCPHYLTFAAEEIHEGATEFKCAPPIRERENLEKLWVAVGDGTIDLIATDHSPCPPAMKIPGEGDFMRAWGGISSLQLSLPAVWTDAAQRGYAVPQLVGWMSRGPARLAGLERRKGAIAAGCDADLVIWNPNAKFVVEPLQLQHRHKITPYAGRTLAGVVETTILRGRKIYERGEFCASPIGRVLHRGNA
ncbi:MAG TPA: allantoinase AllB [Candidatus Limnocylindria bacterium]|nr:allantoinase AllB [Candidatus Limnocylindria bacterium]